MKIKKVEIKNFKSYKKLKINFEQFNVLIGPNAAGKSNCIQGIKFFRDIVSEGLDNAISMQGGIGYIKNLNSLLHENDITFSIIFVPDKPFRFTKTKKRTDYEFRITEFEYRFVLEVYNSDSEYKIKSDKLTQTYELFKYGNAKKELLFTSKFTIAKKSDKFTFSFLKKANHPLTQLELKELLFIGFKDFTIEKRLLRSSELKKSLLLETPLYFMPHVETLKRDFAKICIYDFNPKQPKTATSVAGKARLEENGENLALVLKRILVDDGQKRKFINLLTYLLPFVETLDVESLMDKYLQIVIKEKYSSDKLIPGFLLSDGTVFLLAIIIAMYFEEKPIVIFEEPERRIHPYLISKVIDMMKDASASKQIILSTHNPEIVKYAGIENISFVSRDNEGFSKIVKAHERGEIKTFLENEIGIEELYIHNLLS
ncbi:MAG: AAA family ATPase [bacterium]